MNKSLSDFDLPLPNMQKERYIQNLLMDAYVSKEDDLLPEVAKEFFDANYKKLNQKSTSYFSENQKIS